MPRRLRSKGAETGAVCPSCMSPRVYRSQRRGWMERGLSLAGATPRRCHECNARYMGIGRRLLGVSRLKRTAKKFALALAMAAAVVVILGAILYFSRSQAATGDARLVQASGEFVQV